jgi:hypothetical protein
MARSCRKKLDLDVSYLTSDGGLTATLCALRPRTEAVALPKQLPIQIFPQPVTASVHEADGDR